MEPISFFGWYVVQACVASITQVESFFFFFSDRFWVQLLVGFFWGVGMSSR